MNCTITAGNRMTAWQFIGFVFFLMPGTLFGALYAVTGVFERRIEQTERRVNERFNDIGKRFDDMNRRLDDLRQLILSQQKAAPPQR